MSRDFHRKFQLILKLAESLSAWFWSVQPAMFRRTFGLMIIYDFVFQQSFSIHLQCVKPSNRRNSNLTCIFFSHMKSVYINNYTKTLSLCIIFRFDQCYGHFMDQSFTQLNEEIVFWYYLTADTTWKRPHMNHFCATRSESASSSDHQLFYYKIDYVQIDTIIPQKIKSTQVWCLVVASCRFKL